MFKPILIKKHIIANRYKCLTFDALQGYPDRRRAITGARFFLQAVSNDPALLQKRVSWKVWIKIAIAVVLPPRQSRSLFIKMAKLFNLHALLVHVRLEP